MLTVTLAQGKDKRLHAGHPWIYRSEIARVEGEATPGAIAVVHDHRGRFLGQAMLNLRSQIAGRLLSHSDEVTDEAFLERRIRDAVTRDGRSTTGPGACRLIYGEGDRLPGLIVDRYADLVVVQLLTAGMERLRDTILDALRRILAPRAIYERSDSSARRLEGLELRKGFAWETGETGVWIREGDLAFFVEVAAGQKTGFFLDQRENRQVVKRLARGREVLDCFCYSGGFSVSAGGGGAAAVTGIDISDEALSWAGRSAERNGLAACCTFTPANAFDQAQGLWPRRAVL